MEHTYTSGPFNSTPFSSCCRVASLNGVCAKCGTKMAYHDNGLGARRREVGHGNCLMCGKPRHECYC